MESPGPPTSLDFPPDNPASAKASPGGQAVTSHACSVRYFIDAMNVIGSRPDGWWRDRPAAMVRLVGLVERWATAAGHDAIIVFDDQPARPISSTTVGTVHAPGSGPDAADDEIVRLIAADPRPSEIRVVTSDRGLAERVRSFGAAVVGAKGFREELDAV